MGERTGEPFFGCVRYPECKSVTAVDGTTISPFDRQTEEENRKRLLRAIVQPEHECPFEVGQTYLWDGVRYEYLESLDHGESMRIRFVASGKVTVVQTEVAERRNRPRFDPRRPTDRGKGPSRLPDRSGAPSERQLDFLRSLALRKGRSFTLPRTSREASTMIDAMLRYPDIRG